MFCTVILSNNVIQNKKNENKDILSLITYTLNINNLFFRTCVVFFAGLTLNNQEGCIVIQSNYAVVFNANNEISCVENQFGIKSSVWPFGSFLFCSNGKLLQQMVRMMTYLTISTWLVKT